jgi:hypothetical protein
MLLGARPFSTSKSKDVAQNRTNDRLVGSCRSLYPRGGAIDPLLQNGGRLEHHARPQNGFNENVLSAGRGAEAVSLGYSGLRGVRAAKSILDLSRFHFLAHGQF